MHLLLVRHAETESNTRKILQGHADTPLTARGLEQAGRLAQRLTGRRIDAVYSSDLLRARRTAEIVMQGRDVVMQFDERLRERCFGEFQGRAVSDLESALKASGLTRDVFRPVAGENYGDVEVRISAFLEHACARHAGSTVLVVSHSGTNRVILRKLLQRSTGELLRFDQDNTCVNEIKISADGTAEAVIVNCLAHLDAEQYTRLGAHE
jgi:broad specificity phosphatase PhoE